MVEKTFHMVYNEYEVIKMTKWMSVATFFFNLAIFIFVMYAMYLMISGKSAGNLQDMKFKCFRYFTVDSNVLVALFALPLLFFSGVTMFGGKSFSVSTSVLLLKFVGTVSVCVTFLTVVFFLVPTTGKEGMYDGSNFYMHLLVPIISILSFVFFDGHTSISWKQAWLGVVPVLLYGIVYLYMVIIRTHDNGGWKDFYGFNADGKWYISIVVMFIASYVISLALVGLRNLRLLLY